MNTKPGSLQAIAVIWIISGILSILWGFGLVIAAFASFIGIICLPLAIYPFTVGIIELIYGIRLTGSGAPVRTPPYFVAILEICLILWFDVLGFIAGIVTLVLLNGDDTKAFFSQQTAIVTQRDSQNP